MRPDAPPSCAVLLAGGRGTRFWPRSRTRTPKQLLNIAGRETMLRETVARLETLVPLRNIWAVTNVEQAAAVRRDLRGVPPSHILAEPLGRNTAAAIGLAAIHLVREHGDALMAVLPSDSYVADTARYRRLVRAALELARVPGQLVVLGIPPTRPETGFGYIELGKISARPRGVAAFAVRRFTEKPALPLARKYVASRKYLWNAGMFFWRASTFLENLERFLPATHAALGELARSIGTRGYPSALRRIYPRLENISVDYAVMEPATREGRGSAVPESRKNVRDFNPAVTRVRKAGASRPERSRRVAPEAPRVFVIPAKVGWSDIGSWAAVYELLAGKPGANVSAGPSFALDAEGNYFWSPKKFVAAIGVRDLVVVETPDALLVCSRHRSQDVAKIVKWLDERKRANLL
jgi:mannose-1-phosphate guanylyltransferase